MPETQRIVEKILMADSEPSLRQHLEDEGHFVLDIMPVDGHSGLIGRFLRQSRIGSKEFFTFNREFSVLLKAGLPVVAALDTITGKAGEQDTELNRILRDIRTDIASGESLSGALEKYSRIFSRLYVALVRAGEKGGDITTALLRYMTYMKKTAEIRRKVMAASVYPMILTIVSIFTLLFLFIFVVPAFTQSFFDAGTPLPAMTLILVRFSLLVKNNSLYLAIGAAGCGVAAVMASRTVKGRMMLDRWQLAVPVAGETYRHYITARLTRTMGAVLSGGTPLVEAVKISGGVMENRFLVQQLQTVIREIEQGRGFASALGDAGILPRLALRMVDAGESSGALEQVLDDIADFYDSEVDHQLTLLTSAIEPILMVIMGLIVGFIVLAMYMPVFQMAGTVS